jgi:MFS superfamily sulfate permease-like transporter
MANHVRNALAGVAMAGLMLPEAVAYAGIAGLAPGRALIAAVVGGLAYAVIGRSRFAVVSPTSSSAAILAASLASLSAGNGMTAANATALTLLAGMLFIGLAAARWAAWPVRGAAGAARLCLGPGADHHHPPDAGAGRASRTAWFGGRGGLGAGCTWGQWRGYAGLRPAALALLLVLRRWPGVPGALIVLVLGVAGASLPGFAALGIAQAGPAPLLLKRRCCPAIPRNGCGWCRWQRHWC